MPYDFGKIKHLGLISSIGFIFVGGIVGGFLLGSWLDSKFNTKPFLTLLLLLLGITAAFIEVFRILKIVQKDNK